MIPIGSPDSGVALLYHDVVPDERADETGITTEGAWRYKIPPQRFRRHLQYLSDSEYVPTTASEDRNTSGPPLYLTFDDGGRSSTTTTAPLLEEFDIRGHFFVITDRIGTDGYLSEGGVKELADNGHVVGSHTASHPDLTRIPATDRRRELAKSKTCIEELVGQCRSLSIPRGRYNPAVFKDAFQAGYDYVFTSEPLRVTDEKPPRTIGRWNIWNETQVETVRWIVEAEPKYYFIYTARWYTLKYLKRIIGFDRFVRLRDAFF